MFLFLIFQIKVNQRGNGVLIATSLFSFLLFLPVPTHLNQRLIVVVEPGTGAASFGVNCLLLGLVSLYLRSYLPLVGCSLALVCLHCSTGRFCVPKHLGLLNLHHRPTTPVQL